MRAKVEKSFQARGSGQVTRAIMVEYGNEMAAWSRQLRRLGTPSDRLQPAYTLVRKVIRTYDKGAKCYARGGWRRQRERRRGGRHPAGTDRDCGAGLWRCRPGNGASLLYKADAKGDELKAKYG